MANDRKRGSPDDQPEPDKTIVQPKGGGGIHPERTIVQGGAGKAASPGDTMAQGGGLGDTLASDGGDATKVGSGPAPVPAAVPDKAGGDGGDGGVKGRVFATRFEVQAKLGEGGMGVVYRAKDREIEGREIALKVLRPRFSRSAKFRELFFREIHAAQGFVSEHVVQVRDTGKASDGTLFLTMDLVDGESLDSVLSRESSLNQRHALEIVRQTLLALASGHEKGFVHRDIKPQNVMLIRRVAKSDENPYGVGVRVLDFGIAGLTAQMEEGQIIGTPRYMSPEQVQGQRLDARSDLFSVGIMLYEMLSGSRPFDGDTPEECRTAILETNVTPMITELSHLSEPIRKILTKALQKNRDKRFQSAAEFVDAIEKSRAFREKKGVPAWIGMLLFVSIAGAGGLGYLYWDLYQKYLQKSFDETNARLAERSAFEPERAALQKQIGELQKELSTRGDALVSANGDKANAEQDKIAAEQRLQQAQQQNNELKSQMLEISKKLEELKEWKDKSTRAQLPSVVAAQFFDDVIGRIQGGFPDAAFKYLQTRKAQGQVDVQDGKGASHLASVLEAADAFHAAKAVLMPDGAAPAAGDIPAEALGKAIDDYQRGVRRLAQAMESSTSFELEAKDWLAEKTNSDAPAPPERLAELQAVRAGLTADGEALARRIEQINGELAATVKEDRAALQKLKATDDPAPLIQHLRRYPEAYGDLQPVVDRLAAAAEAACAPAGRIDLDKLGTAGAVKSWGEFLLDAGSGLAGKGVDTFRWLWAANLWYGGDDLVGPAFAFLDGMPAVTETKVHPDWRATLQLQRVFQRNMARFLVDGQGVAVYRQRFKDGATTWFHEVIQLANGATDRGEIVRKPIDADGEAGRAQNIEVSLSNGVFLIANIPTLDLRAHGETVHVAYWQHAQVEPLPAKSWAAGLNHEQFRRDIGKGMPCLVFDAGNQHYWFAPGFGLVRQEVDGAFERELCFTARKR